MTMLTNNLDKETQEMISNIVEISEKRVKKSKNKRNIVVNKSIEVHEEEKEEEDDDDKQVLETNLDELEQLN
jgi:aspartate/glutamate racemase